METTERQLTEREIDIQELYGMGYDDGAHGRPRKSFYYDGGDAGYYYSRGYESAIYDQEGDFPGVTLADCL